MNAEVFERWFQDQLLPNIPPHSVIVMDNASYRSRSAKTTPSSSWRKAAIQERLRDEGVDFDPEMRKVELARPPRQRKEYVLDNLAREAGHDVIRLPPYHCDLNPIELIWAQMKVTCASGTLPGGWMTSRGCCRKARAPSTKRCGVEVFTGHIFSPNSNQPRKVGSKSIPLQIKKKSWNIQPIPCQSKNCCYLHIVEILSVLASNTSNLAHISQSLLYSWDIALILYCLCHVV